MPSLPVKPVSKRKLKIVGKPLVLLGEAQGKDEAKIGKGFVGSSGIELLRMLAEAGVIDLTAEDQSYLSRYYRDWDPALIDCIWEMHPEVYRTNVFQQHPPGNDLEAFCGPKAEALEGYPALTKGKYVRSDFAHELDRLGDELLSINPNLIVCLGNTALWAMAGKTGISKLRGTTCLSTHTASGFKLLPTYHPAGILRQWDNRPVALADLMKANREKDFPDIRRIKREIWIEPTLEDINEFIERYIRRSRLVSVDIETSGNQITCIGFSPDAFRAIVIPFLDRRAKGKNYWPDKASELRAWEFVSNVLVDRTIPKLFQNGLYDIAFLLRSVGIPTIGAESDSMLLHHALQPESLKGLGFMASVYCDEGAWKQMRTETIKRDD
jgi:uracil-DNA glycosylase